jgi:acyl-CoA synthetase (NDP forming)
MSKKKALERMLRPETVAIFGGDDAAEVVRQCKAIGFDGEIWAVNPNRDDLDGIPCVASLDDLPGVPDASFVAAPPQASLEIIRDLAARGAPGAVCFASGFAETGTDGEKLQQQLRDAAGDMALIGPNCHGFLNYLDGVALWPDKHGGQRTEKGVAIISQSGNVAINLTMQQRSLDIAYVISIGNNSTLYLHDYIDILLDDPRVTAIGLHIESIQDVSGFSKAAIKALKKAVPVVALKTGRSSLGAEITMSHTASLAGPDRLYSALFERVGVARCDTVPQFLETLKFLSIAGPLPDKTIASMSCSGGEASLVADCAATLHIDMPALSDDSARRLQEFLGPNVHVANPLDYHTYIWGDYAAMNRCFAEMLGNKFACTLLVLDYPQSVVGDTNDWGIVERAFVDAVEKTGQRSVIVSSLPESQPADVRDRIKAAGVAPMQGIEECLFAIRAAAAVGEAQREVDQILPVAQPAKPVGTPQTLDEWQSKQALAELGVSIPDARRCAAAETVDVANGLGYPVVLKAISSDLAHKTEAGAVAVNLRDADAVTDATRRMASLTDNFLVESMVLDTVAEMIVGVSRDETFGLTLTIGSGGTLVELLDDTKSLLLPVQRHEIRSAIETLKVGQLIDGYRGGTAGNLEVVLDAVLAIARFADVNNEVLIELDVNPLIITPSGAVAADAFIRRCLTQ